MRVLIVNTSERAGARVEYLADILQREHALVDPVQMDDVCLLEFGQLCDVGARVGGVYLPQMAAVQPQMEIYRQSFPQEIEVVAPRLGQTAHRDVLCLLVAAICHLTLGCERFKSHCAHCPYLPGDSSHDLADATWRRKERMLAGRRITFVACSHWLESEARQSRLLEGQETCAIPNPIDTRLFAPADKAEARRRLGLPADRRLILFASQRVNNVNKGMDYLIEACRKWEQEHPEIRENTGLIIVGGHAEEIADRLPLQAYPLGYVNDPHASR